MGGQNVERREILRVIGLASIAGGFPGFRQWAFACNNEASMALRGVPQNGPYQPLFFSKQQYDLVTRIAEMIIPADGSPGAAEAGVPEFIDFMIANRVAVSVEREIRCTQDAIEEGNRTQERFVAGLGWIDARSYSEFARGFLDCKLEQQNALLKELAYKKNFKPLTESGRDFFQLMRDYTVVGYYTSKIGLEALGYPGLRPVWPSMPGCSHPEDPEHVQLREQKNTSEAMSEAKPV